MPPGGGLEKAAHARAETVVWRHGHVVARSSGGAVTWVARPGGGTGGDRPGSHLRPGRVAAGVR